MVDAAAEASGQRRGDRARPRLGGGGGRLLAEGGKGDALGHAAAADGARLDHCVDAQLGLHALDHAARLAARLRRPAAEELARLGRGQLEWLQDEGGNRAGAAAGEPTVELPAHAVRGGRLGECFAGAPDALDALAGDQLRNHLQAQAARAALGEPLVQRGGQRAGGERGGVDALDRVLRGQPHGQVRGREFGGDAAIRCGARDAVDAHPAGPEAGGYCLRGQLRELAQRGDAQLAERVDGRDVRAERHLRDQGVQWLLREELRGRARGDELGGARGNHRGGQLVGRAHEGFDATALGGVQHHFQSRVLASVEAGRRLQVRRDQAGAQELDGGGDVIKPAGERGEHAPVAVRVVLHRR